MQLARCSSSELCAARAVSRDASRRAPRVAFRAASAVALFVVAACSDPASAPAAPDAMLEQRVERAPQIVSIALAAHPDTVAAGSSVQIDAIVRDNRGEIVHDVALTWLSSNPTVGTISPSGVLTGVAGGNVIITATSPNFVLGWVNVTIVGPPPTAGMTFSFLDGGDSHTCGVSATNEGWCWGWNFFGQLGNGRLDPATQNNAVPERVLGGLRLVSIDAGGNHTCAVNVNGKAFCWGLSDLGQIGSGLTGGGSTVPVAVAGHLRFASVTTGLAFSCGLTTTKAAYCWGGNYRGQLGLGHDIDVATPSLVAGGLAWARVRAGLEHTCGITDRGRAYCWGTNEFGQLGSGQMGNYHVNVPTAVSSTLRFSTIETTASHTCAAAVNGETYCWGMNDEGQLGDGTTTRSAQPVRVHTALRFVAFALGAHHSCGVTAEGLVYCWGYGGSGQLGNNSFASSLTPVPVQGGVAFTQLLAGANHSCGVATDGRGWCWGAGVFGTLGNGASGDGALAASPVRVMPGKQGQFLTASGVATYSVGR